MGNFLKRAVESPFIILLGLADLIKNSVINLKDAVTSKVKFSDMLSQINWTHTYDIVIRIILTVALWYFYRDYVRFKRKKDAQYTQLKSKIIALNLIMHDADEVLINLIEENINNHNANLKSLVKALQNLGVESLKIREEDTQAVKYKGLLNRNMDEKQQPLYNTLNEWDED